ncbi:hypothetical protein ESCO_003917 [Escovopsis weberi]|uniref:Cytochrome b-c1 complex subunit 10 n=1 Tax=Escovopsis weberi TaxID=150374 RepID=A0A0M8N8D9_ESCWE|nr:hypothetical protein ESCO_003917 [Escovopsis weberi]
MVAQTPFRAAEFKSQYGPKYSFQPNFNGVNAQSATRFGFRAGTLGAGLSVALLLYGSSLPRVRADILSKFPFVGRYFVKEQPHPADNPF